MVLLKYGEAGLSSLTIAGGAYDQGVVFEIANSGFVVPVTFAGTPGQANCYGQSFSRLAQQYGGLDTAAAALGYSGATALQDAMLGFCGG